ncbi:MAG: hypothetical protein U5J78_01310 [Parasphingorhabdus sp.]|nr:hypothetical protein [Parasphingorhabdus sp.]
MNIINTQNKQHECTDGHCLPANPSRRALLGGSVVLGGLATMGGAIFTRPANAAETAGSGLTPQQALQRLKDGNAAFVADRPKKPDMSTKRRLELASGQAPFAALVGCADSPG